MTIALVILSTTLAQAGKLPEGWARSTVPEFGLSVVSPKEVKRTEQTDKDRDGKDVKFTLLHSTDGPLSFIVAVSEFDKDYIKQDKKKIFDNARDGSAARSKGKTVRDKEVKLGKLEGREFVTEVGDTAAYVRARVFVANEKQYSAMVAGKTKKDVDSDLANRFLDSLRISAPQKSGKVKKSG